MSWRTAPLGVGVGLWYLPPIITPYEYDYAVNWALWLVVVRRAGWAGSYGYDGWLTPLSHTTLTQISSLSLSLSLSLSTQSLAISLALRALMGRGGRAVPYRALYFVLCIAMIWDQCGGGQAISSRGWGVYDPVRAIWQLIGGFYAAADQDGQRQLHSCAASFYVVVTSFLGGSTRPEMRFCTIVR